MNCRDSVSALRNGLLLVLLATIPCLGQVNVEDQRLSRDSVGLGGSVGLSVEIERGNSDLTEISLDPGLVYRVRKSLWFLLNSYTFVEADGSGVVNEGFTHLRYNYDLSRAVVIEALAQSQYNREQQLERRYLLGGGLRLRLLNKRSASLALGLTAMHEDEKLRTGQSVRNARNSDYIAVRFRVNSTMVLANTVYVQPLFEEPADVRILDNLRASFKIAGWLVMTAELEYQYDARPPDGVKVYDFSLKNGLTARF